MIDLIALTAYCESVVNTYPEPAYREFHAKPFSEQLALATAWQTQVDHSTDRKIGYFNQDWAQA